MSILLIAAALAGAPVNASATPAAPTRIVHYADLDLASDAGQKTLRRRIRNAVSAVCGSYGQGEIEEYVHITKCRRVALASVRTQMARFDWARTQVASRD